MGNHSGLRYLIRNLLGLLLLNIPDSDAFLFGNMGNPLAALGLGNLFGGGGQRCWWVLFIFYFSSIKIKFLDKVFVVVLLFTNINSPPMFAHLYFMFEHLSAFQHNNLKL